MGIGCLKTKRILFPKREIHDLNSKEYVEMRKLNDNFYTITRYNKAKQNKKDKKEKTKVEIETEILNELIKLKKVGDTYSSVIRRLLDGRK